MAHHITFGFHFDHLLSRIWFHDEDKKPSETEIVCRMGMAINAIATRDDYIRVRNAFCFRKVGCFKEAVLRKHGDALEAKRLELGLT